MTTYVDSQADTQTADAKLSDGNLHTGSGTNSQAVHHLIEFSLETAQRLADEAAQVETPGFKLLLKAMAERHVRYARELARLTHDPAVDVPPMAVDEVELGLRTIQTSMTLQREGRQDIMLSNLVSEERALLEKYDNAIAAHLPSPIGDLLKAQKSRLNAAYNNMRRVADGRCELVARVYENYEDGERAITSLRAQGIDESDIDVLEGEQMRARIAKAPSPPKTVPTTVAGAIGGGIVGLIVGVAWWFLLVAGADAANVTVAEPLTVGPVTLISASILFGAFMGAVFGWFIGRNKAEDDAFVTQQSVQEGEILVAAYVDKDQVSRVERTLHVHHGRELAF